MRNWLLEARKEKGLTQLDVAKKLDISEGYYSYIESGVRQKKMDMTLVAKLSAIFDIPLAKIVEMEQEEANT